LIGCPVGDALGTGILSRSSRKSFRNALEPSLLDAYQENPVAATCDVCGKGPSFGHNISHSHRRTKRRWNPNIQRVRTLVDGVTPKRLNVCTSCLKAGKVARNA
jgi:large subunit ribosomal protein L28